MFNPVTFDLHVFPVFFGGTIVKDVGAEQLVVGAPSMHLVYFIAVDTKRQIEKYVFDFIQAHRMASFYSITNIQFVMFIFYPHQQRQ